VLAEEEAMRRVSSLELARSRVDLSGTAGFLVADAGRVVGQVEGPMYGPSPEIPDALSVRSSLLRCRRRLVPADAIDERTRVIGLRIERAAIRAFL
jgi:hypothetical protein